MKYLQFYKKQGISEKEVFENFIKTIRTSIKIWDYFVNWQKVNENLENVKIELNLLNSLIGCKDLETDFINLVTKYPNVVKTLPVLIAIRDTKIQIINDYKNHDLSYISFDFNEKKQISKDDAKKYFSYIKESGLIELFQDRKIKNFVDYVFGVEVGLDSNGRKNRGGTLMEEVVEVFVKKNVSASKDLDYLPQATPSKILGKWNYNVKFEISARSFDFAVFNKKTKKLFLIETNFYNGGGSKLKAVCGEFKSLFNELKTQNIELIWITDGDGWITAKRPLEETFNNNNYVFNLEQLDKDILDEVFSS